MVCLSERPSIEDLQNNTLFAGIPDYLIGPFCNELEILRVPASQVIFEEGNAGDCLFLVNSGSVRISKIGGGGNQETLGFIEAGNYFGEMALIDNEPRSATALAITDVELVPISEKQFLFLVSQTPYFALKVMRILAQRLRATNMSLD